MPDSNREQQRGLFYLWHDHFLLLAHGHQNTAHRHVAASLIIGMDGPLRVQVDGHWHEGRLFLVAPEREQALESDGRLLVAHFDPDTWYWRQLVSRTRGEGFYAGALPADCPGMDELDRGDCQRARVWLDDICRLLSDTHDSLDPRVVQVTSALRAGMPEQLDLAGLARLAGVSESRLTHLFKDATGVTLKRFLLHLKIQRALRYWSPGMTLTQLAADAGFYDQPHLVRTARAMFDALPSQWISEDAMRLVRCSD